MIKVYNKSTNYLRVSGKTIAPLKTVEFESRNSQIRVLERNGIISVSEVLSNNTIPHTTLTNDPEIKEESVNVVEVESKPVYTEPVVETEVIEESVKEEVIAEVETVETKVEEKIEEVKEEKIEKKSTKKSSKKATSKKKGGNK